MARERSLATHRGEQVVTDFGLEIPVDPFKVAANERIEVVKKPTGAGVSGFFMRVGDNFLIAYNGDLNNEGFERFSVAHELGHYFLDGHVEHVLAGGAVHESRAGFLSKEPHEVEADQFAVGLLLPTSQFTKLVKEDEIGLGAMERLAARCRTSLTATAIRVTECSRDPVAIVVCNTERVEFTCVSDSFWEFRDVELPHQKEPIPRKTATYELVGDPRRILEGDRVEELTHLQEWFGGGPDIRLIEEVVGLGRYGKTLTVLTPEVDVDQAEQEEDEALIASWTPTFTKSRRR